jgi:hypothetical protein
MSRIKYTINEMADVRQAIGEMADVRQAYSLIIFAFHLVALRSNRQDN